MSDCKPCSEDGPLLPHHVLAEAIALRYLAWSPEFCHELARFVRGQEPSGSGSKS